MANFYVVSPSSSITSADLVGGPYDGYQIVLGGTIRLDDPSNNIAIDPSRTTDLDIRDLTGTPYHTANVTFVGSSSGAGGTSTPTLDFGDDIVANVSIDDNIDVSNWSIDAAGSEGLTVDTGTGSKVGNVTGSSFADNVTIGGTAGTISMRGGTDSVTVLEDATVGNVVTGGGNDTVELRDDANADDIRTGDGQDSVTLGNSASTDTIDLGNGTDVLNAGNDVITDGDVYMDGGADNVTYGDNATIDGFVRARATDGDNTFSVGENSTINGEIFTQGGHDDVSIGSGSTVNGQIDIGDNVSLRDEDTLTVGDNVTINYTGNDHAVLSGNNVDDLTFGDGLIITGTPADRGIYTGGAADNVSIGTATFPNVSGAGVYMGGGGNDILTIRNAPVADLEADLISKGWTDPDGDGIYRQSSTINDTFEYDNVYYQNVEGIIAAPCFTSGTLILTERGEVRVEALEAGDMVVTRDHGLQPVRWIGSNKLTGFDLKRAPKLCPIRIRRHALGTNIPSSDLIVSPQHRILVRSSIAQKMFGAKEVLVAAKQLCLLDGIDVAHDLDEVEYFHILFDTHEVVVSNGAETESLYTGPEALKSVGRAALEEIFTLFPELKDRDYVPQAARTLATGRKGRQLAFRHKQNARALVN